MEWSSKREREIARSIYVCMFILTHGPCATEQKSKRTRERERILFKQKGERERKRGYKFQTTEF